MQQPRSRSHEFSVGLSQATAAALGRLSKPALTNATFPPALPPRPTHTSAQAQTSTSASFSAVVHQREPHTALTNSFNDARSDSRGPSVSTPSQDTDGLRSSASPSPAPSTLPSFSNAVLAHLQRDYPAVYAALHVYEKAVRHHREKFKAKETELLRCIGVGEELLEQIDALKHRCEVLAHERDDALAMVEASSTSFAALTASQEREEHVRAAIAQAKEAAEATSAAKVAEAARTWQAEKRGLVEKHEAQCARFREQLQDALQQAAVAQTQQREVESALYETRAQLRQAEHHLHSVEEAYAERESASAMQRGREAQQQHALLEQQLAQVQQQAEVDRETVLAEATVELERLQRALVRAEKEAREYQRMAEERPLKLTAEPSQAATLEIANLRRQLRQLEDMNHDLQLQLRRKESEARLASRAEEGRLVLANNSVTGSGAVFGTSTTSDEQQQQSTLTVNATSMSAAAAQRRLQDENARLRQKMQEVARQAQDDVDAAHDARLELQQQVKSIEAQMHLLRSSVIAGLEQELAQAREQVDIAEAHSRDVQEVADALEVRVLALQSQHAEVAAGRGAEQQARDQLQRELQATQEHVAALQDELEKAGASARDRDALVVHLQREKQQFVVALRTLQAQTATIEGALAEMHARDEAGAAARQTHEAQLQAQCAMLEHDAEASKEERLTLCSRLRDAEEAVDVLKDAQRVAQEAVRDAQRRARESEDRARLSAEQRGAEQQGWRSRLAEAEQEAAHLKSQLREISQRLREHQEELTRKDAALRQSADKTTSLMSELRQVREVLASRDDASWERWRQQYAQNAADREQVLADREREIATLQGNVQDLQKALAACEDRVEQMQVRRQEVQATLSEAVASSAAQKGRIAALEDELARAEKERAASAAALRQLKEQLERASAAGGGAAVAGSLDATKLNRDSSASLRRITELETKLFDCEEALRDMEVERQRAQRDLLHLMLPSSLSATDEEVISLAGITGGGAAPRGFDWAAFSKILDEVVSTLSARQPAAIPSVNESERDASSSTNTAPASVSAVPDACQRAVAAVVRSIRDVAENLRDEEEQRWAALKHAVLTMSSAHDNKNKESTSESADARRSSQLTSTPKTLLQAKNGVHSSEELRERLVSSSAALTTSLECLHTEWSTLQAELAKAVQSLCDKSDLAMQREQLTASLSASEEERAALEQTLGELRQRHADAARKVASLQSRVEQLQGDLAGRATHIAALEKRLEGRQTEMQAERAEWFAKWQESQRHREKEKAEHEAELQALRSRLTAAEDTAASSTDAARRRAEEAQQELRAQMQKLQTTCATTEATLRQQVATLTQEKAQATQGLRSAKSMVAELEVRVGVAEAALQSKDEQLTSTTKALQEMKRAHHQTLANGVAAEAYGQESAANQIASLQSQLHTCRQESEMMEQTHAAERAELQALRKVNASLESRLAEVEEDRAPLRQQLHSLLASADK